METLYQMTSPTQVSQLPGSSSFLQSLRVSQYYSTPSLPKTFQVLRTLTDSKIQQPNPTSSPIVRESHKQASGPHIKDEDCPSSV